MSLASLTSALSSLLEQNTQTPSESVHRPAPCSAAPQSSFYLFLSAPSAPTKATLPGPREHSVEGVARLSHQPASSLSQHLQPLAVAAGPRQSQEARTPHHNVAGKAGSTSRRWDPSSRAAFPDAPLISAAKLAEKEQKEMLSKHSELTLTRSRFFTLNLWKVFIKGEKGKDVIKK